MELLMMYIANMYGAWILWAPLSILKSLDLEIGLIYNINLIGPNLNRALN